MTTPIFTAATAAHQQGRLEEAKAGYLKVLKRKKNHADALHQLGMVYLSQGDWAQAQTHIRQALAIKENAIFLTNLGIALKESQQLEAAHEAYQRALTLEPKNAKIHNNLGNLLKDCSRLDEAEAAYQRAIALQPGYAESYNHLALLLAENQRWDEAEHLYRKALQLKPDYAHAYNNLASLLKNTERTEQAEAAYRRAIELKANYAEAYNNLGVLLGDANRFEEAQGAYQRATELKADYVDAYKNWGVLCGYAKRWQEAEALYQHALAIDPGHEDTLYNLSLLLLSQERYREGWPLYELRYAPTRKGTLAIPALTYPRWQGESLEGKSLVVWPEQGLGDQIQCARYAPLLKKKYGLARLTLLCAPALKALLQTVEGVDLVCTDPSEVGPHDYWSFFLSLPLQCNTHAENFNLISAPYLHALPERVAHWRPLLPSNVLKVGLVYKGNAEKKNDPIRSLPHISTLAPLWSVPGIHFINLQKGQGENETLEAPAALRLTALGKQVQDLADTAAIVSQLDLVICVDTAMAHLAGALGKPCWVLLPANKTDWRWQLNRSDSPWYPSLRLFRQEKLHDWEPTVAALTRALQEWAQNFAAQASSTTAPPSVYTPAPVPTPTPSNAYASPVQNSALLFAAALQAHQQGRIEEALAGYQRVIALQPRHGAAYGHLGMLLQSQQRYAQAEQAYRQALQLDPQNASTYNNLGILLASSGRLSEAEAAYRHSLTIDSRSANTYNNLGNVLLDTQRWDQAEAAYRLALALQPNSVELYNNLGNLLKDCQRLDEAQALLRHALALQPQHAPARFNLGLVLLMQERYEEAWPFYEYRYAPSMQTPQNRARPPNCAQWRGEPLAGKSLLLVPEQGWGDSIQFVRYAHALKARGVAQLSLLCDAALKPLLGTAQGIDVVITSSSQMGVYDYWSFTMSLPLYCGTTAHNIDQIPVPYLHALPERIAQWQSRLPAAGRKVGLVWKGDPSHANDAQRSIANLSTLAPLWDVRDTTFISLQKEQGEEEAAHPPAHQPLLQWAAQIQDFADTAAIVSQLDLVICVDTAIAHVAGALGKPCWVLLPAIGCDWRWQLHRSDSPWYPSVRLFRQEKRNDWGPVVAALRQALQKLP